MATASKWTPFGVALDVTATSAAVSRTTATQYTVKINVSWKTSYSGAKTNYGMTASSGGASATINTFGKKADSGSGTITGTYSISGNGSATKTITVTFKNFNSDNGNSATKSVSFNVTVPAWTSYTITYNDNNGSGGPGKQTKWKNQALTISSTKPKRTGYTFLGWSTSSTATSATYTAGGTYPASSNANVTLYAVWKRISYTVKYNANGGSSTPANQTKYYGETLKLAGAIDRTNYNFKGWATSATATSAAYAAGGNYTNNAAVTLYAVWELAYVKPRISGYSVVRCDSSGNTADDGTYMKVSFTWASDKDVTSIIVYWKLSNSSSYSDSNSKTLSYTGKGSTVSNVLVGNGNISPDQTYDVKLVVTDGGGNTSATKTLASQNFLIDFYKDGTAIAIGKAAESPNLFDVDWNARMRKHLCVGNKTAHLDGNTGTFLSSEGYIQIQRSTDKGYYPYIGFYIDDSTTTGASIKYDYINNYLSFEYASKYYFANSIYTKYSLLLGYNTSDPYGVETGVNAYWADGSTHWALMRTTNGLGCGVGWVGSSTYKSYLYVKGQTVYLSNSSGNSTLSDIRMKKDFTQLDKWEGFFDSLEPVAFKLKAGSSGRYHIGFKAQQVEEALLDNNLTTQDFGGFVKMKHDIDKDDVEGSKVYEEAGIYEGDDEYGLIYSEFIALNTYKIQKMQERIDNLEDIIREMQLEIKSLKGATNDE